MKKLFLAVICLCLIATTSSAASVASTLTRREKIISAITFVACCAITIASRLSSKKRLGATPPCAIGNLHFQLETPHRTPVTDALAAARFAVAHWENARDEVIFNRLRAAVAGMHRCRLDAYDIDIPPSFVITWYVTGGGII